MKKLLLLAVAVLTFSACTDDEPERHIDNFTARASEWKWVEDHYEHTRDNRYLTRNVVRNSLVKFYVYVGNGVQQELPYTRYYKDSNGKESSIIIDYAFAEGEFTIFYTASNFSYFDDEPGPWDFRVVVFY